MCETTLELYLLKLPYKQNSWLDESDYLNQ